MHAVVADLSTRAMSVAIELERIASGSDSLRCRVEAILAALHRLVPFDAGRISILDPNHQRLMPLATYRRDDPLRTYLTTSTAMDEIEQVGLNRAGRPLCRRDLPVSPSRLQAWTDYLWPAGYREGLGLGLFTPDGRYLGVLGLNTDTVTHPTDTARDIIGLLSPIIAQAVDPLQTITETTKIITDAEAGVVLTRAGSVLALPGLPAHPLLAAGSAVLTAVAERLDFGRIYSSFLCPHPSGGGAARHVRVTVLACPPQPAYGPIAAVLVSPPRDLRGLTPRELQIVGLLIDGWTNAQIAADLIVAERTVATHVEHILYKLGAPTRALAAVRALRYGVYVPRPLNGVRASGSL